MVTLLLSMIADLPLEVLGMILVVLECIIVLLKFLQYFVAPDSKFGIFLKKALKGFIFLRKEFKEKDEDDASEEQ